MVEWSFAIFHKPLNARSEINCFSRRLFASAAFDPAGNLLQ